ncbi:zinc-dependent alcohol dehydrogenase family protein [Inhella gelatinilytica]|uniref:enoyl-[acyl-carrier-protein] reductase n=1 Tax=Inhella gelatinilytica TaxID=2795030 RepID=A0A931ND73_9BURK|nr:zinc-dependent alcohol dehydrogenase family protein [Inhella gelatinilytica]MBH9552782.1 zinc-dependent alcohol dehydrogenase family protein [Inhella gelatinilytica]
MTTMLKAQYAERGPIPQAVIAPVPFERPVLSQGQALVAVLAAPINPSDVLMLTGQYGLLPPLPAVGGSEGVGRVVELGPDTQGPAIGQTVLLPAGAGTWATHVVAPAARLIPLPNEADPQQLAMLTVNPPTASLLLSEFVALQPGDWVIQNSANSGVGSYVVQLAKLRGLKTVNIVRRESAVAGVQAQGGDVVLVDGDDLAERVKAATGGAEIRLGIDAVGGKATMRLAGALAESATIVNYGALGGEACTVSPRELVFRDVTLKGFWLARWFRTTPQATQYALLTELAGLIAAGKLRTPIQATYDVAQIQEAITAATADERQGKILITPAHG